MLEKHKSSYQCKHASIQIINQVLLLAYNTQACIWNLKTYAMQASTWICTYQIQPIKVHELAPPTCVLLLFKNFDPFTSFNVAPPLCLCPCPTSTSLSQSLPKLSYLCTISPPLSSISIKGVLLIDAKVCIWDRWLRLESYIFYGHHLIVGMTLLVDTTCRASWVTTHRIFDLDTSLWGTSPYVIAWGHSLNKLELL